MGIFGKIKEAELRSKVPFFLIVCMVALVSGSILHSYILNQRELTENKHRILSDIIQKMLGDINETCNFAKSRALMLASVTQVSSAFRARDRKTLLEQLMPMFEKQHQKYNIAEIHFYDPPAKTFLMLHREGGYGEDLSSFSKLVVASAQKKIPQRGVELGKNGAGMRGTAPVLDKEGFIGVIGISFNFKHIINKNKALTSSEIALLIDTEIFNEICTEVALNSGNADAEKKSNIIGAYTYLESSNKNKTLSFIKEYPLSKNDHKEVFFSKIKKGNVGIIFYPLHDYEGKVVGKIIAIKSFEDLHRAFYKKMAWEIIIGIILMVLLAGFVFVVFRALTIDPILELNKRCLLIASRKKVSLKDFTYHHNHLDEIANFITILYPTLTSNSSHDDKKIEAADLRNGDIKK